MAVTDLTGTTWVLNGTITFSYSLGLSNITSFNFTSNNASFYGFYFDVDGDGDNSLGYRTNQEYSFNQIYDSSGNIYSGEDAYKTIAITGGTDATNSALISWLEANATLQTPSTPRKSVDLTTLAGWEGLAAKTYDITIVAKANGYKDSAPSAAVQVEKAYTIQPGVYKWVDNPVLPGKNDGGGSQPIKFSSNALTFISLSIVYDRVNGYSRIRYRDTASDDWIEVYKTSWANINYKTITVSETFTTTAEAWYYYTFGGSGNLVKQPSK